MTNRVKLFIYSAFLAIAFAVTFYLLYNVYDELKTNSYNKIKIELAFDSKQAAIGIKKYFEKLRSDLVFLSSLEEVKKLDDDGKRLLTGYYNSNKSSIKGITRIDKNGKIIYTYPFYKSIIGKDVSYQEHNKFIMTKHEPIVSDVFETIQGFQAVAYAYPIFENGNYEGCISLLIPFENLTSEFMNSGKSTGLGSFWMVTDKGREIFCVSKDHIGKPIDKNLKKYPKLLDTVKVLIARQNGIATYTYFSPKANDFITRLTAFTSIKLDNSRWIVFNDEDEQNLFILSDEQFIKLLWIFFVFSLVVGSSTFLYFRAKRRARKQIDRLEKINKITLNETGQIAYQYNIDTGIVNWSGQFKKILGYSEKEFAQTTFEELLQLVHPDERIKLQFSRKQAIENNSHFKAEYQFRHKDGRYIFVEENGALLPSGYGLGNIMVGTLKDISDRKEAELELIQNKQKLEELVRERTKELQDANKQLQTDIKKRMEVEAELIKARDEAQKANKLKSDFLAQISHEIRTPMNTIQNYSYLIREEIKEADVSDLIFEYFNTIEDAKQRLIRTIELILNMSEAQRGDVKVSPELINIASGIVEPIYLTYKPACELKKININFNNYCEVEEHRIDSHIFSTIITNFVDNAVKYTHQGQVDINLFSDEEKIICEVVDTGIGISKDYLPHIFEPFSQETQGYTRKYEGNGLGMALIKIYADLLGASLHVQSEQGKGSTFRLVYNLPKISENEDITSEKSSS